MLPRTVRLPSYSEMDPISEANKPVQAAMNARDDDCRYPFICICFFLGVTF